jgi:hypothetical protein
MKKDIAERIPDRHFQIEFEERDGGVVAHAKDSQGRVCFSGRPKKDKPLAVYDLKGMMCMSRFPVLDCTFEYLGDARRPCERCGSLFMPATCDMMLCDACRGNRSGAMGPGSTTYTIALTSRQLANIMQALRERQEEYRKMLQQLTERGKHFQERIAELETLLTLLDKGV